MAVAGASVLVVGSGAAGLAAAVAAAAAGAEVVVFEAAPLLGGSTAFSAGTSWFPANYHAAELGMTDNSELAIAYLQQLATGDADAALIRVFVEEAGRVATQLEELTRLRWRPLPYPDYHSELYGGSRGGRSLEPLPLVPRREVRTLVRKAPTTRTPAVTQPDGATTADAIATVRERETADSEAFTGGRALVAALAEACLDLGVTLQPNTPARLLAQRDGAVTGLETSAGLVEGQVVLATGGFERDAELVRAFLRGPTVAPVGAAECRGDGLRMALAVGAALGNMTEAWWCPSFRIPEESFDGQEFHRLMLSERARPGSMIVDELGRRFANEAQNYNDFGRTLQEFDAAAYRFTRARSWFVFDSAYRTRYNIGPLRPDDPDPAWLVRGADIATLGEALDIDAARLRESVDRFNQQATAGVDEDFGRGSSEYDRFMGDAGAAHPNLGPLREAPFYALPVEAGCLGTKGGPRSDADGRVLSASTGRPISGLFAVGNAAASPFGFGYPGAGGTIGPALVFGHRAGTAAATAP